MENYQRELERALLRGTPARAAVADLELAGDKEQAELCSIVSHILHGRFSNAIAACLHAIQWQGIKDDKASLENALRVHAAIVLSNAAEFGLAKSSSGVLLSLGVASLMLFTQLNYTGPGTSLLWLFRRAVLGAVPIEGNQSNAAAETFLALGFQEACRQQLWENGEEFIASADAPFLLALSRAVLVPETPGSPVLLSSKLDTAIVWALRCARIHQDCLGAPSTTLRSILLESIVPNLSAALPSMNFVAGSSDRKVSLDDGQNKDQKSKLMLEISAVLGSYWHHERAKKSLENAADTAGIEIELSGVLGRRTRWQKFNKSQLVVLVSSRAQPTPAAVLAYPSLSNRLPTRITLDSDVLLERPSLHPSADPKTTDIDYEGTPTFKEEEEKDDSNVSSLHDTDVFSKSQGPLTSLAQCMMAQWCSFVASSQSAGSELTAYEVLAYARRVLDVGTKDVYNNWSAVFAALYYRSIFEYKDSHRQDRALLQLESHAQEYRCGSVLSTAGLMMDSDDENEMEKILSNREEEDKIAAEEKQQRRLKRAVERERRKQTVKLKQEAEQENNRTVELDEQSGKADREEVCLRMEDIFSSGLPSRIDVLKGWADLQAKLKIYRGALAVYKQLRHWEGVINQLVNLGRRSEATRIIRGELDKAKSAGQPTASLLYHLAEATQNEEYYEEAWTVSNSTFPKAQRRLADLKRMRNLFAEAIPHYEMALEINSALPFTWFSLGFCYLEIKDLAKATHCFSRVVSFNPDYAEAWNNLASCHVQMNNHKSAFNAIEQAVRLKSDSWKVWENYLTMALKIQEWSRAMSAIKKVVQLKTGTDSYSQTIASYRAKGGKKGQTSERDHEELAALQENLFNAEDLEVLCGAALLTFEESKQAKAPAEHKQQPEIEETHTEIPFLFQKFKEILEFLGGKVTASPTLWKCMARVFEAEDNAEQAVECREKHVMYLKGGSGRGGRALRAGIAEWDKDPISARLICEATEMLVAAYINASSTSNLYSARLILDGTLSRIQKDAIEVADGRAESQAWEWRVQTRERMTALLERVKQMELAQDQPKSAISAHASYEERGYEGADASDWA